MKRTEWKYYIKDDGETSEDAVRLDVLYDWQDIYDHEDAAIYASEDEWNNRDGWEGGFGDGPVITVVSPDGVEVSFRTERELSVDHTVSSID